MSSSVFNFCLFQDVYSLSTTIRSRLGNKSTLKRFSFNNLCSLSEKFSPMMTTNSWLPKFKASCNNSNTIKIPCNTKMDWKCILSNWIINSKIKNCSDKNFDFFWWIWSVRDDFHKILTQISHYNRSLLIDSLHFVSDNIQLYDFPSRALSAWS